MDQDKINQVVSLFFSSLKSADDKLLETGLTQNTTVDLLHQATIQLIQDHPKRFEQYVKFFEEGCMYLQDESEELPEVDEIGR